MAQVGEVHLQKDQMNRILAALLTIASLGGRGAQSCRTDETMVFYEDFLKRLNEGPIAKAFGHSP
jgi:hypothetical protein